MTSLIHQIWKTTAQQQQQQSQASLPPAVLRGGIPLTPIKNEPDSGFDTPVIKVEPVTTVQGAIDDTMGNVVQSPPDQELMTAASSKAQRAARRDAVNARRDKRKSTEDGATSAAVVETALHELGMNVEKVKKMKMTQGASPASSPSTQETAPHDWSSPSAEALSAATATANKKSMGTMMMQTEIDPSGEERLRALEAQLESLDPDSKEAKKKRRLIRNRMSAQLHRERKKAYVGQLEEQLQQKEKELQVLHEKMTAMLQESSKMKKQLGEWEEQHCTTSSTARSKQEMDAVQKDLPKDEVTCTVPSTSEKLPALQTSVASPALSQHVVTPPPVHEALKKEPFTLSSADDSWDYCLNGWEADMTEMTTRDLLHDFDNPFGTYGLNADVESTEAEPIGGTQLEIHAAKKNIAMMMAVVFSVTFFGDSAPFYNVANGSGFASMFGANPPRDFSQVSIASRIVASLEKTSWKDFRDISSWIGSVTNDGEAERTESSNEESDDSTPSVMSPSAASDTTDTTDSCCSPSQSDPVAPFEADLIDDFVYPVDDPFAPVLSEETWLEEDAHLIPNVVDVDEESTLLYGEMNAALSMADAGRLNRMQSLTSRLYEKLTALWQDKNQVLLTVSDRNRATMQRSIADMTTIRKRMENGNWFGSTKPNTEARATGDSPLAEDQSVTFLYPLSAFAPEKRVAVLPSDEVFLEVSCQLNALKL